MQVCGQSIGHKVAVVICVTLSLSAAIFVYYWFAAMVEEKGMLGVYPLVDGYLRYSTMAFFCCAMLTYIMTFFNLKPTRIVLIVISGLVIGNLTFALVGYFACRTWLLKGYKPFFASTKYVLLAEAYEKSEHCCGWTGAPELVHTQDCSWNVTCDAMMRREMGGVNLITMSVGVGGALGLMIYVMIAHIWMLGTGHDGYANLMDSNDSKA